MIAVDVVVVHAEPFTLKGREAHKAKREGEGAVETVIDEIPGEGSDGGGETLGGFIAGPARWNGGDGTRLQEEELVVYEAPLDVLGEVIVLFDAKGESRDLGELFGGEGTGGGFLGREGNLSGAGARRHNFVRFLAEALLAERMGVSIERKLIDLTFTADDGFTKAEIGIDQEFGEISFDGIDGEGHTGDFTGNHLLDNDGHSGLLVREFVLGAVGDGAVREKREEAAFDGGKDAFFADAVEKRFVLASEGGESEILESGRRANGECLRRGKCG